MMVYADRRVKLKMERSWRQRNPQAYRTMRRRWCQKNPEKRLSAYLKTRYGITLVQYNQMVADQNGLCAICKEPPGRQRLVVDHCHTTKIIRGLLCSECNLMIGLARHSVPVLESSITYLQRNS